MIKKKKKMVIECTCQRCGYVWEPKSGIPKMCTACKSYRWNEPKKEKENEN